MVVPQETAERLLTMDSTNIRLDVDGIWQEPHRMFCQPLAHRQAETQPLGQARRENLSVVHATEIQLRPLFEEFR